ncbi:pyocin knob domain-containing protein [Taibaiella chishuiensis]|uniref:Uncharacterized protein n=1 Tax=Taibaiella chishuiensis TaxID=1434707 RepID=A0A2P8D7C2_9BACT|nr:pyocin knob domain-containing protein [Taibaiella chishuiensis]PSK93136.1 hypothetical protein B0I18_102105 [Taibaiella chishuiensis]
MLKLTPCVNAPLLKSGIPVDSLYFTKAPGDPYLSVYARYQNNSEWIPLHIGLRAAPTLQQVRDEDRNIAINSGSYDDAHLYLRSADGDNMTAAFYTNATGAAIQAGNTEDFQPLHLQPEGGLLTYNGSEVINQDLLKAMALARRSDTVTDFNSALPQGIYNIPYGLTAIPNYPHIGNNNNGATAGMLIVYQAGGALVQYFYPSNETSNLNRNCGYWYRKGTTDRWEYKNAILEISLKTTGTAVKADDLVVSGEYYIAASNLNQYITYGYPDSGATIGGIPFMLTVRKRFGAYAWTTYTTQEIVSMQESPQNQTRKWIRSKFNWQGENVHAWDAWNEVGLLRDVYTKTQMNTSGAGGHVHWDNIDSKPTLVNTETDPTVPGHVKTITAANITSWNAKEDAANKNSNTALGNSNTLYPTQNAVKVYVDNAITTNNTGFIQVVQKGAANGVATLGANGKIPNAQIPALAITETFPVNNQAEMLALTAETGDVAVRNDVSKSFILKNTPASVLANWIELKSPTVSNTDQVPEGTQNLYFTTARARTAISTAAPLTYNSGTGSIGITQASVSANGYLSATDWATFNNKQNALGFTPENSSNKTTSLSSPNNTTYPTTQAVSNAISAAAANLQQTTDRGNTTTKPLIVTGSHEREVKTHIPTTTDFNTIISGTSFKWFNDLVTIGAIRGGSTDIDSFGIDINGNRRLTLDKTGNFNVPGTGDFGNLVAHESVYAQNTQPYTSGTKFIAIWNGTSGRFEYTTEVFLKTETDPVYTAQEPYIVKTKRNSYDGSAGITLANAVQESGFTYSAGSDGANINGPFISAGQLNYGNAYLLQLAGAYGESTFKIRTRNGDIGVWNPWRKIYTDADSVLTTMPSLNDVATVGNTISKSGATFNAPQFKIAEPDQTKTYSAFWVESNGLNIQPGNQTSYANTVINPIGGNTIINQNDGKVGIGINPAGVPDKLTVSGSLFVSTGNGTSINFEGGSHIDRYNGTNLNIVTNGLYWNSNLLATQSWTNTNTIQNQIATAQNANTWISGESRAGSLKAVASNREIRTYFASSTPVSTLVAATEFAWYNDRVAIGAVRGGSTDIEALGVEFNGTRALTLYPGGSVLGAGAANFGTLNAQQYLSAQGTPQYTSGAKLSSIWNGTTGRYEYVLDRDASFTMKAAGGEVNSVIYKDTRSDNPAPNGRNGGTWWDFKTPATVGLPAGGNYAGVLTLSPYHDNSGLDGGANVAQIATYVGKLLYRSGSSVSTWGNWKTIATFEDIISSGMFLQNQFSSAQSANAWISGALRANRLDLTNGQNISWGGGYNPGIPTISATNGTGITFYPDGSNGPNGGLQVTFPTSGSIKVAKLATGTPAMVVADANGLLTTAPIPDGQIQWQDLNSNSYMSAKVPPGGSTGQGLNTAGGFAAMGRRISSNNDYLVKPDDYILIFLDKPQVTLPNPASYKGRILKLRAAGTGEVTLNSTFRVLDDSDEISVIPHKKAIEIQSIDGDWHLVSATN